LPPAIYLLPPRQRKPWTNYFFHPITMECSLSTGRVSISRSPAASIRAAMELGAALDAERRAVACLEATLAH
jgi:hypothetical protein